MGGYPVLRQIGVVAAVLAAFSVGACQKVVTEAQYDRWIAYLRENPEEVGSMIAQCAEKEPTQQQQRQLRSLSIAVGVKQGSLTPKLLCTNIVKAAVAGRLTYVDMKPLFKD